MIKKRKKKVIKQYKGLFGFLGQEDGQEAYQLALGRTTQDRKAAFYAVSQLFGFLEQEDTYVIVDARH